MCCDAVVRVTGPVIDPAALPASEHVTLAPERGAPMEARRFVAEQLQGIDADTRENMLLLTSELVTNGILHARTPVVVGVTRDDEKAVLVTVADEDDRLPVPLQPSPTRLGGRGLALVDQLSSQWGVVAQAHGKTVWFLVDLDGTAGDRALPAAPTEGGARRR